MSKRFRMKHLILVGLACFSVSRAGAVECGTELAKLTDRAKDYHRVWLVSGGVAHQTVEPSIEVSLRPISEMPSDSAMELLLELERAGGKGEFVQAINKQTNQPTGFAALKITSPPKWPIYGHGFHKLWKQRNSNDDANEMAGIFISLDGRYTPRGTRLTAAAGASSNGDSVVFYNRDTLVANIVHHERQHGSDEREKFVEFWRKMPALPEKVVSLVEKKERGEELSSKEEKQLRAYAKLEEALSESRAAIAGIRWGALDSLNPIAWYLNFSGPENFMGNAASYAQHQLRHSYLSLKLQPWSKDTWISLGKSAVVVGAMGGAAGLMWTIGTASK